MSDQKSKEGGRCMERSLPDGETTERDEKGGFQTDREPLEMFDMASHMAESKVSMAILISMEDYSGEQSQLG